MKIVYIVKYIAQLGGLDRVISYKMNYFANDDNEVTLITYEQGKHQFSFELSPNIKHFDINVRFFTLYKYNIAKKIISYLKMRYIFRKRINKIVQNISPDIIVILTDSYNVLDILLDLSKKNKIVVESHVERNSTIKSVDYKQYSLPYFFAHFYDSYILKKLNRCNSFISLTQKDSFKWKGIKHRVIIPNPLTQLPNNSALLNNKKIISVGRLEPQKGYEKLLIIWSKVTKKHPEWELNIYGDGAQREILLNEINRLNITKNCFIHHAVTNIYEKYMESSIYVMSSNYEGFGLVLAEAMSCGLPCISFDCPNGPADIIRDKEDGLLIKMNNIEEFAEAICFLIENEKIRKGYGMRAQHNIIRYSPNNIMPQWEKLFNSLVQ